VVDSRKPRSKAARFARHPAVFITEILLILCVGALILWVLGQLWAADDKYAAIREMGLPVTIEEMNAWYVAPPDDENAAELYTLAFERLVLPQADQEDLLPLVGDAELPESAGPPDAEMMALIAEHLEKNTECLKLLHQATAKPHCHWPLDFGASLVPETGDLMAFRDAASLLSLQAVYLAEMGDSDGAVDALVASVGVARANARVPVLISQFAGMACWPVSCWGITRVLNRGLLKQDELARLGEALMGYEEYERFWMALVGELYFTVRVYDHMAPGPGRLARIRYAFSQVLLGADKGRLMRDIPEFIEAAKTSPRAAYLKAKEPEMPARIPGLIGQEGMTDMKLDGIRTGMKAYARTTAQRRMVQVAIAVERYRLADGKLPDTLEDLVPEYLASVPVDPFDGESIRYRKTEPGYVVYSVALNEVDDGGVDNDDGGKSGDFTFTVAR
jgi:hypothetical protein